MGAKTALDLIQRFGSLDYIYENLDEIDIKKGVHDKLANDKEKAYLSLELGTIRTDAPVDTDINSYTVNCENKQKAVSEFVRLELFSLIDKFSLNANEAVVEEAEDAKPVELTFEEAESGSMCLICSARRFSFIPIHR